MVKYLSFHNYSFALMFYCKWQCQKGWAHAQLKKGKWEALAATSHFAHH
jgi:hypothetical protein